MLEVFRASAQRLLEKVQTPKDKGGNMPVITGFLRSSMVVTLNTPHVGFTERVKGKSYTYDPNQYGLVLNGAQIGDTIYAAFTANYAIFQEYGTTKMAGNFFVRHAAQQWSQIVNGVIQEVRDF